MLKDSVRDHNEGPRLMTLGSDSSGSYNKKRTFWRLKMGKSGIDVQAPGTVKAKPILGGLLREYALEKKSA